MVKYCLMYQNFILNNKNMDIWLHSASIIEKKMAPSKKNQRCPFIISEWIYSLMMTGIDVLADFPAILTVYIPLAR